MEVEEATLLPASFKTLLEYAMHIVNRPVIRNAVDKIRDYNPLARENISEIARRLRALEESSVVDTPRLVEVHQCIVGTLESEREAQLYNYISLILPLDWSNANLALLLSDDKSLVRNEEKRIGVGTALPRIDYARYIAELLFIKFLGDRHFGGLQALIDNEYPEFLANRGIGFEYLFVIYLWCKMSYNPAVSPYLRDATYAPDTSGHQYVDDIRRVAERQSFVQDRLIFLDTMRQYIHYDIKSSDDFVKLVANDAGVAKGGLPFDGKQQLLRLNLRIDGGGSIWSSRWEQMPSRSGYEQMQYRGVYSGILLTNDNVKQLQKSRGILVKVKQPLTRKDMDFPCFIASCNGLGVVVLEDRCFCSLACATAVPPV